MRICGFHIDGFGIFNDQGIQDIPDGFVLFCGQNESGKSTLMEFLRTVLFGPPKQRKNVNKYEPLRGGNHGGRLRVTMRDGRMFTIERAGRKVTITEDGGNDEPPEIEQLLGGIDRKIFERIFAVGLKDLQGLGWLAEDAIGGRMLAASIGTGAESVPATIEKLASEISGLLGAKQARRRLINACVRELQSLNGEIRELQAKPKEYAELQSQRAQLEEQIRQKRLDLARVNQLVNLRNAIDDILKRRKAREDRAVELETQLSEITVDKAIIGCRDDIGELMENRQKLVDELKNYPEIIDNMRRTEEDFQTQMSQLGSGWSLERLNEVDTSDQTRQHIQRFDDKLSEAERKYYLAQDHQRRTVNSEEKARITAEESQKQWDALAAPLITDAQEIKRRQAAARGMFTAIHDKEMVDNLLGVKREKQQQVMAEMESLDRQMEKHILIPPLWTSIAAVTAGIASAVALALVRLYIFGVALSVVGIGLAVLLYMRRVRQMDEESRRIAQLEAEKQEHGEILQELTAEIVDLESQLVEIDEKIKALVQDLGVERLDSRSELAKLEKELEDADEKLRGWNLQKQKREETQKVWKNAREQLEQATQEMEDAHGEFQSVQVDWQRWLTELGFDQPYVPAEFRELLDGVEKARKDASSLQGLRERAKQIETYLADVRGRISNALNACGLDPSADDVGEADLDALDGALNSALGDQQKRENLERQLGDTRKEIEKLGAEVDVKRAKAADEDESFQMDKESLKKRAKELGNQVSQGDSELGKLEERLTRMAQNDQLGELLFTRQQKQAELRNMTRRWATLMVCRHLVERTRDIYEHERQPKVIQEATRFVSMMTDMPYRLVMPVGEADNIQLEDDTTARKNEIGWSTGLADQVYLAMRLAWAQDFAEHAESLPLILDDVLVTFDPSRQLGAAKVILDMAQRHQIIMFTCQPGVKETVKNALEECEFSDNVNLTCYTLERGTIRGE